MSGDANCYAGSCSDSSDCSDATTLAALRGRRGTQTKSKTTILANGHLGPTWRPLFGALDSRRHGNDGRSNGRGGRSNGNDYASERSDVGFGLACRKRNVTSTGQMRLRPCFGCASGRSEPVDAQDRAGGSAAMRRLAMASAGDC